MGPHPAHCSVWTISKLQSSPSLDSPIQDALKHGYHGASHAQEMENRFIATLQRRVTGDSRQIEKMLLLNICVIRLSARAQRDKWRAYSSENLPAGETTAMQRSSRLPSTFQPMLNVRAGYPAARLNGSRASLASYFKSLRRYSNTQLLWCKQRPLVTRYYSYGVYKSATLM